MPALPKDGRSVGGVSCFIIYYVRIKQKAGSAWLAREFAGQSKQLKAFAVTSKERSAIVPDIPTISETVLPGFDLVAWMGLVVPAGTPKPIRDQLTAALSQILARQDVKERFLGLGAELAPLPGEPFRAFLEGQVVKWKKLVTDAAIQPE
jgi:tripartite-type tricarboxylate transporter receptor subunit TctC